MKVQLDQLSSELDKLRQDVDAAHQQSCGGVSSHKDYTAYLARLGETAEKISAICAVMPRSQWDTVQHWRHLNQITEQVFAILETLGIPNNVIPFRPRPAPLSGGGDAA